MELAKPKLDELESDLDRAIKDAAMYESMCRFDVEDFADFLQFGATLDDSSVLDIFVHRVTLGDEVMVWLNYSLDGSQAMYRSTNLPQEVGTELVWLHRDETLLNALIVGVLGTHIVMKSPRFSRRLCSITRS